MSRNAYRGKGRSNNAAISQPNTVSPHIKIKAPTCKVRSCRTKLNLNARGFCQTHARVGLKTEHLYANCKECGDEVFKGDAGVACDKCCIWYHIECVGMSTKQYECMMKDANTDNPMFHWYCRFCKNRCMEAVAKIDLLENQTSNLASKVTLLNERVNTLENKMTKSVKTTVTSEIDERTDIDRRKFNLMVFNMPEPVIKEDSSKTSSWYTNEKKKADMLTFTEISAKSLKTDIPQDAVADLIRLGSNANGRIRPLKLTFRDINAKRDILGKAKLLAHGQHKSIFISPDLTPQQRESDKKLRLKLKERRDNGEKEIYISRGKIVDKSLSEKPAPDNIVDSDMPDLDPPQSISSSSSSSDEDDSMYSDISTIVNEDTAPSENEIEETNEPQKQNAVHCPEYY